MNRLLKITTIAILGVGAAAFALGRSGRKARRKLVMANYRVNINMTRGGLKGLPKEQRRAEAKREVKLVLVRGQATRGFADTEIPDFLGTDDAVTRFLDIEPPIAAITPEFQDIVDEIEDTYVVGHFFAAISSSCVSIERVLNLARIELHQYHKKIKQ